MLKQSNQLAKSKNNSLSIYILLASGLSVYLLLRGIHVQMLHDSIASFFRYIYINKLFPYNSEWSANNHFLNSMLMWVSYQLFGSSAIALKLPNILSFGFYVFFTYKISGHINNPYLRWGFLISMLFAHNYFEFFGVARGYGISMAFLSGGIWHSMLALKALKTRNILMAMIFLSMASYANLTLINSMIILWGLILLRSLPAKISNIKSSKTNLLVLMLTGALPIGLIVMLLLKIQSMGELYYGEPEGIFQVSVISLAKLLSGSSGILLAYISLCASIIIFFVYVYIAFRDRWKLNILKYFFRSDWIFFFLLCGNILAFNFEHILFGTDFPEDRTGLFLYPLFIGYIFFGLSQITFPRRWIALILIFPLGYFPIHFLCNMNLSWSSLENHSIPQGFYSKILSQQQEATYPPTVGGYESRVMRWNHMNFRRDGALSTISFSSYPSTNTDYLILTQDEAPMYLGLYDSIDSDPNSLLYLFERKQKLKKRLIVSKKNISTHGVTSNEFTPLFTSPVDKIMNKSAYVGVKLDLVSEQEAFHAWAVASVSDKNGIDIKYEFIPLYWFPVKWDNPSKPFTKGFYFDTIPAEAVLIKVYIWNIGDKEYEVRNADVEIFIIEDVFTKNK